MEKLKLKKSSVVFLVLTSLSALFFISNSLASAEGSSAESGFFVSFIADNIFHTSTPEMISSITFIVRKLAHFTEFALFFAFFNSFMISLDLYKNRLYCFLTMFLALLVPLLDETTQYLSPGRTPKVYDIWVDAAGCIFGIVVSAVIFCLCRRKSKKSTKDVERQ